MNTRLKLLLVACLAAAACSPEAARTRGGGLGADTNNRPAQIRMHEGSNEYFNTPARISGEHPPLDPAQQARLVENR